MRPIVMCIAFALASLAPAVATAQPRPCAEGRERSAASQGRCCWPGQSWSTSLARCDGPPSCPAGFIEEGDGCIRGDAPAPRVTSDFVAPAPAYAPPPPPTLPPAPPAPTQGFVGILPDGTVRYGVLPERGSLGYGAPRPAPMAVRTDAPYLAPAAYTPPAPTPIAAPPTPPPEPPPEPPPVRREPYNGGPVPAGARVESSVRVGLVVAGPILFLAGYFYGYTVAVGATGALATVPLVGPILSVTAARARIDESYARREIDRAELLGNYDTINRSLGLYAIPSLVVQTAGLSMTIAGAVARRRELVYAPNVTRSAERPWAERLAIVPEQTSTYSGLSLVGVF